MLPVESITIEAGRARLIAGPDPIAAFLDSPEGLNEAIEGALASLSTGDEFVIRQRFGIGGESPKTQEEIAAVLGVTNSRVGQIEHRALRQLRHPFRSRRLKAWLESSEAPARIDRKIAHYPWEPSAEKPDRLRVQE